MKLSGSGRWLLACAVSIAVVLGVSACGNGTIGYLWVLAGKSSTNTVGNVITGYKISDNTGNLTEIVHSPFTAGAGGSGAPQYSVVVPGGRYLYTVNLNEPTNSVVLFSIGGDGVLAPQQAYGTVGATPAWFDLGGGFLYVLDSVSPARNSAGVAPACTSPTLSANKAPCGSVEVFSVDSTTGLLTPVLNTSIKVNNAATSYFPVGPNPSRIKVVGGSVVVLNGDDTATIFGQGSNGQLTTSANSLQVLDQSASTTFTSMTTGGSYLYLTDGTHNLINQYTVTNGVLQPGSGSPFANVVANTTPVWTLSAADGTQSYLYVLNSGSSSANSGAGSISVYSVDSANGRLTQLAGLNSQYTTGANPVCMVSDPTNRYLYTSNADGTVTGFQRRQGIGDLQALRRGSQFVASGKPTCLVTSGITS